MNHPTLLYRVWKTGAVTVGIMPKQLAPGLVERQASHLHYAATLEKVGPFTIALTIHGDHRTYCRQALAEARDRFTPEGDR